VGSCKALRIALIKGADCISGISMTKLIKIHSERGRERITVVERRWEVSDNRSEQGVKRCPFFK
jgi:hypothetical protein